MSIPELSEIQILMTRLLNNYTSIQKTFFDMFYNPTPMDIELPMFNDSGEIITFNVPNRAKDFKLMLNGSGNPEGVVEATVGTTYQDTDTGTLYIKSLDGNVGWSLLATYDVLQKVILNGHGSPDGSVVAERGTLYVDTTTSRLYIKESSSGSMGWDFFLKVGEAEVVTLNGNQTITNKTVNCDNNTLLNISTVNFKSGVIRPVIRDVSMASDESIVTELAVSVLKSESQTKSNLTNVINADSEAYQYPNASATYSKIINNNIPLYCVYGCNSLPNGTLDIMDFSQLNVVEFKVGGIYPDLMCNDCSGENFAIEVITGLDVSSLTDGEYNLFISNGASSVEAITNTIYRQVNRPTNPLLGDVWVSLTDPLKVMKFNGVTFEEDLNRVFLGTMVVLDGNVSSLDQTKLSYNGWDIRYNTALDVFSAAMPDYFNKSEISGGTYYEAKSDGVIKGDVSNEETIVLEISFEGKVTVFPITGDGSNTYKSIDFEIKKGTTYNVDTKGTFSKLYWVPYYNA